MQICGAMQDGLQAGLRTGLKQRGAPFIGRFIGKLLVDAAPAALASLVGGFLFTQYQYGRPPQPTTVQIAPASAEMMELLRDEHTAIVDYLRAQVSSEKNRQAAENQEDATAHQVEGQQLAQRMWMENEPIEPKTNQSRADQSREN